MTKYVAVVKYESGIKYGFDPYTTTMKYIEFISKTSNIRTTHGNRNQASHLDSVEVISILRDRAGDKHRYIDIHILELDTSLDVTELFQVYAE